MEHKKYAISLVAILIITIAIFAYFFQDKLLNHAGVIDKKTENKKQTGVEITKIDCSKLSSQDSYKKAVEESNVEFCACINDENQRKACQGVAMDSSYLAQAIEQMNKDICQNISSEERKKNCLNIVGSGVDYLKKNDPQKLAELNSRNHDINQSIVSLEEVVKSKGEDINSLISLAMAYTEKGLGEQEHGRSQASFVEKALAMIERAKLVDQNNSEVYRAEGYAYEVKPDYDKAIASYDKAIELAPNNAQAYAGRGHTYRLMGVLDKAADDFYKAADFDGGKEVVSIYTNLCSLEAFRNNFDKAVDNCTIVVKKENVDPMYQSESYQIMSVILLGKQEYSQAESYLLKAKALTPNDANLHVVFAKLNIYQGNYAQSEANSRKAIELSPTKTVAYLALSHALYMQDKYQDSIQAAEKGWALIKTDVSLMVSDRASVERELNYSIANNYRELGNAQKQKEYEEKGEAALKANN